MNDKISIHSVNSDSCYTDIELRVCFSDISLYPVDKSTNHVHDITGFKTDNILVMQEYCESLLQKVDRWNQLKSLNALSDKEISLIVGDSTNYDKVDESNYNQFTATNYFSYDLFIDGRNNTLVDHNNLVDFLVRNINNDNVQVYVNNYRRL